MSGLFGRKHNKNCCCGALNCCGRCLPLDCLTGDPIECDNGLPMTLTADITATPSFGTSGCFNGSATLTFKTPVTGGLCCWEGTASGSCTDCNGATFNWTLLIVVCCGPDGWVVTITANGPCGSPPGETFEPDSCDPVLLSGCFAFPVSACFVGCMEGGITPIPSPEFTICFDIYETP